ncbi:MAG: hypothetical protein M3323_00240 [Actinomycetota bacterium]|nr:hypothetical protein [Actinomycetota bacterium]
MATGALASREALQGVLAAAENATSHSEEPIEIIDPHAPETSATGDHPHVRYLQLRIAGVEAVAELAAKGLIVPMDGEIRQSGEFPFRYRLQQGSQTTTGTVRTAVRVPALAGAYRLPHNLLNDPPWFLDVDLFLDDLTDLELSDQLVQILREAFQAFRHGLFLACAGLLGAVSEGAWYAVAEGLAGEKGALRKALDGDRTAHVQKLLADEFRQSPRAGTTPDDLLSHASLLRDIRNFGVHPRGNPVEDLSDYLTEEACALLILNTHRYLQKLAAASARLDPEDTGRPLVEEPSDGG